MAKLMPDKKLAYADKLQELFSGSRSKQISRGQIIQYQDDTVSDIQFIRDGYVKAYIILDSGENRTMFILGRDDIFPLSYAMVAGDIGDTVKYFYEAMTDVDSCSLSIRDLKNRIDNNPHFTTALLSYLAHANESTIELLESTKSKASTDKVASAMRYLASKTSSNSHNDIYDLGMKLSHQDIADLCGVTRETVSVAMKTLENQGLVKLDGRQLMLKSE